MNLSSVNSAKGKFVETWSSDLLYQTQQATLSHFIMIQLLLILITNAGRLEGRKKQQEKKKQTKKGKVRP